LFNLLKWTAAALLASLLLSYPSSGESSDRPRNSVSFGAVESRYIDHEQYLGFGGEYIFRYRDWLGVGAAAAYLPTTQPLLEAQTGGKIRQFSAVILSGHRFGPVGLYGRFGVGVTSINVYQGFTSSFSDVYAIRNNPSYDFGGTVDLRVARRWSVQFTPTDHVVLYGQFEQQFAGQPILAAGSTNHTFQMSSSVVFHF
jgi:hypothetical protein